MAPGGPNLRFCFTFRSQSAVFHLLMLYVFCFFLLSLLVSSHFPSIPFLLFPHVSFPSFFLSYSVFLLPVSSCTCFLTWIITFQSFHFHIHTYTYTLIHLYLPHLGTNLVEGEIYSVHANLATKPRPPPPWTQQLLVWFNPSQYSTITWSLSRRGGVASLWISQWCARSAERGGAYLPG